MFKFVIVCLGMILPFVSFSQSSEDQSPYTPHEGPKSKFPIYFGIQARPIFPIGFIEPTDYTIGEDGLETRISQRRAFTLEGVVRMQFTDVFGLETGIHFTHRNFDLGASIPDSSIAV